LVAGDPDLRHVVAHRQARVNAAGVAKTRVRSPRLRPGMPYWFQFSRGAAASPVGRSRLLRPVDSEETARFAWFSCQGWQAGYFTAHAALAREADLDFACSIGDYIYELTDDTGPPERVDTIGPDHDGFAQTLDE